MSYDEFIKEIGKRIREQDNYNTAQPFYCIFKNCEDVVPAEFTDKRRWIIDTDLYDDDGFVEYFQEDHDHEIEGGIDEMRELAEEHEIEEVSIKNVPRFVTAFFTLKGAEDFLEQNHYRDYVLDVDTFYKNDEMTKIREYLLKKGVDEK